MATGPKLATSALEALENDGTREPPFINKYWPLGIGAALGFTGALFANWGLKRPLLSGIQRYVVCIVGTGGAAQWMDSYRNQYLADRDAAFRHYVQLHPEDFPDFPRQKYGDILLPWIPIR